MAIDHGEARLGVALSDPLGIIASPHAIIPQIPKKAALEQLASIANTEGVVLIVVGLPTNSEGGLSAQARSVIRWARAFAAATSIPVRLWDESYSSADAAEARRAQGKRPQGPLDDIAAAFILQSYLEARGSGDEPGYPLETFEEE
jgi:putative Holliday junction resolvase